MKKLRSNSKRKWIVGGVMFFGGIGLLTTGFATWVVGTQVLSQQHNIGITVDTADSDSVALGTVLAGDEAFKLGEPVVKAGADTIVSSDGTGGPTDLKMVFETIKIETSKTHFDKFFKSNHPFKLTLKAVDTVDEKHPNNAFAKNTVAKEGNLVDAADADLGTIREGSSWDYVNLDTITIPVTPGQKLAHTPGGNEGQATLNGAVPAWEESGKVNSLTISNLNIDFKWGSFFGNVAPTEFYNNPDNFDQLKGSLLKQEAIKEELNAMSAALSGQKFYFEIALVEDAIPQQKL